jgi:hypothetical protein
LEFFWDIETSTNIYIIEHALSYQTARRTHRSVEEETAGRRNAFKTFSTAFPICPAVGDFHSHTGWGDLKGVGHLSERDITDA